jgi:hypothetical protein
VFLHLIEEDLVEEGVAGVKLLLHETASGVRLHLKTVKSSNKSRNGI